jgi:hypothetical protein
MSEQPYRQGPGLFEQTTGAGSPRCGMCSSVGLETTAHHPYLGGSGSYTGLSSGMFFFVVVERSDQSNPSIPTLL